MLLLPWLRVLPPSGTLLLRDKTRTTDKMPCFRHIFNINRGKEPSLLRMEREPPFGFAHVYKGAPRDSRIIWVKAPMRSVVPCPYPKGFDSMETHNNYLKWFEELYRNVDSYCKMEKRSIVTDLDELGKDGLRLYNAWEEHFELGLRYFQNHCKLFNALVDLAPEALPDDVKHEHEFWLIFRLESLYSLDPEVRRLTQETIRRGVDPEFRWEVRDEEARRLELHFHYLRCREYSNRMSLSPSRLKAFSCFKKRVQDLENAASWEYVGSEHGCRMVPCSPSQPLASPALEPEEVLEDNFGPHTYLNLPEPAGSAGESGQPVVAQPGRAAARGAAVLREGAAAVRAIDERHDGAPLGRSGSTRQSRHRRHLPGQQRLATEAEVTDFQTMFVKSCAVREADGKQDDGEGAADAGHGEARCVIKAKQSTTK